MKKNKLFLIILLFSLILSLSSCAKRVKDSYKVEFYSDGEIYKTINVEDGSNVKEPTTPTKKGYNFTGWYLDDIKFDFNKSIDKDLKLYAKYELAVYTITYNLNGGYNHLANPTTYVIGSNINLKDPVKQYTKFDGWYLNDDKVTSITADQTGDITLTAKWIEEIHEISYSLNGGVLPSNVPTEYITSVGLATLPTPVRDDYIFNGWYYQGEFIEYIPVGSTTDYELSADWINLSENYFIVTINGVDHYVERYTQIAKPKNPNIEELGDYGWVSARDFYAYYDTNLDDLLVFKLGPSDSLIDVESNFRTNMGFTASYDVTATASYLVSFYLGDTAFTVDIAEKMEGKTLTEIKADKKMKAALDILINWWQTEPDEVLDFFVTSYDLYQKQEGSHLIFEGWYSGSREYDFSEVVYSDCEINAKWKLVATQKYYNITYICDGGTLPVDAPTNYQSGVGIELPVPTPIDSTQQFLGWFDEFDNKIDRITSTYYKDVILIAKFVKKTSSGYKWELNRVGFDGNGMTYEILVDDVTQYDPFLPDYSGNSKDNKQFHQNKVEAAYNITIKYSNWEVAAPWGPERVHYINQTYLNDEFNNEYVFLVPSEWLSTLVKGSSIAELYDLKTQYGIFSELSYDANIQTEIGYIQNSTINEATSVNQKVYGYNNDVARPDYFMYYNVDLVEECGLEDPAELWLKGEWTLFTFDRWINKAQNVLSTKGGYALDMGFAEAIIGLTASTGNQMTKVNPPLLYLNRTNVTDNIALLQEYYHSGLYYGRGVQDVSPGFASGTTLLHHGDLWFMKESTRFNPAKMRFVIGVVPYPAADGEGGIPVTTTDVEEAISIGNGEYLTNHNGEYIKSVDMSFSSFKIPFTGTGCYAVLNVENGKNGINSEIVLHILHDLVDGIGDDVNALKQLTEEEKYRNYLATKFDREIDIEVIMSCQETTYYELIELLSRTVGGGSHFGDGGWWPLAASIIKSKDSPVTAINEVIDKYKQAMIDLGYSV